MQLYGQEEIAIKSKDYVSCFFGQVIPQNHSAKLAWNLIIIIATVLEGFLIPLSLCFEEIIKHDQIDFVVTILLIIDIVINSRTSFFHPDTGEQVKEIKNITKHYITSWAFVLDFLSALPLFIILVPSHKYEILHWF